VHIGQAFPQIDLNLCRPGRPSRRCDAALWKRRPFRA